MKTQILAYGICLLFGQAVVAQNGPNDHSCFAVNPNQQPEASIEACTDLIISGDKDSVSLGTAHTNRGVARRELGLYQQSISDLYKALEYLENDTSVLRMLAWTYREFGKQKKAEQIYTQVLAIDDHLQGWLSRCAVRTDMEHYEAALDDCNEALARMSEQQGTVYYDILYFKALSLNELGQLKEAYGTAAMGFSTDDISGRLYFQAIVALWNDGRTQEIHPVLNEGLERYPGDSDILYFLEQTDYRK